MTQEFQNLSLPTQVLQSLKAMKFVTPTPIQAAAIPIAREGRDLIGCAQTGTGKTAAFCIPLVSRLLENPTATALILSPTRELAMQIGDVIRKLTSNAPHLKMALLIGGSDMHKQMRDLRAKPSIIVATPGRLTDHLNRKTANLARVEVLVLDEGDRMLDMGFEPQIIEILKHVKAERQTMLFSATMPEKIKRLAGRYLKNPAFISVGEEAKPVAKIKHTIVQTERSKKKDVLLDLLNAREGSILIFVNTKHNVNGLTDYLQDYGFNVSRIHGGRTQGQRNQAIQGFRAGKFRILVATDVAARGLDVPHIQHVINFDLPMDVEDYVHRIGRTARAGAEGEAICLLDQVDRGRWNRIAHLYNLEKVAGKGKGDQGRRDKPRRERGEERDSSQRRANAPKTRQETTEERELQQVAREFEGRTARFEDRKEKKARAESRFEGRKESRFKDRKEKKARAESRFEGRKESRFKDQKEGRFEGRKENRFEDRKGSRFEGRKESRFEDRKESRFQDRNEGRAGFGDRPERKFEDRRFEKRRDRGEAVKHKIARFEERKQFSERKENRFQERGESRFSDRKDGFKNRKEERASRFPSEERQGGFESPRKNAGGLKDKRKKTGKFGGDQTPWYVTKRRKSRAETANDKIFGDD